MNRNKYGLLLILIVSVAATFTLGVNKQLKNPKTLYRVYLKGKSLGLIESKNSLEKYIDKKQSEIKKQYGVDKVYMPAELDIEKEVTYDTNVISIKKIYNKIKDISPFTIEGYSITIKGIDSKDSEGKKVKGSNQTLYVLDKKVFTEAVDTTVKSFISDEDYKAYSEGKQGSLEDTGKVIENIYIQNKITIKKQNVPVDKKIYQDKETLSKYLLFGTTEAQQEYTVQDGDTIDDVAFNNKISTDEFLIANPNFTSASALLYSGQKVTLGVLKPQFKVVEQVQVMFTEEKNYETETQYDNNKNVGYTETTQAGVKGENRVTQQKLIVNGETTNVVNVNTEVLKEPIKEIIVKGGKQSSYGSYSGGYGSAVATRGQWGWPATCSSVSSPFGYRWGVLHDGTDIAGCGYGSNIFAAQAGVVVQSGYKYDNGEFVTIDHQNGYYSLYAHMVTGSRRVRVGDYVAKGQVLGGMGRTGAATGVHLHFAIWSGYPYRGGRALNAMSFY